MLLPGRWAESQRVRARPEPPPRWQYPAPRRQSDRRRSGRCQPGVQARRPDWRCRVRRLWRGRGSRRGSPGHLARRRLWRRLSTTTSSARAKTPTSNSVLRAVDDLIAVTCVPGRMSASQRSGAREDVEVTIRLTAAAMSDGDATGAANPVASRTSAQAYARRASRPQRKTATVRRDLAQERCLTTRLVAAANKVNGLNIGRREVARHHRRNRSRPSIALEGSKHTLFRLRDLASSH